MPKSDKSVPGVGEAGYVELADDEANARCRGVVVEVAGKTAVIALPPAATRVVAQANVGETPLTFASVALRSISLGRPPGWGKVTALEPWPDTNAVMAAYNELDVAPPEFNTCSEGGDEKEEPVKSSASSGALPNYTLLTVIHRLPQPPPLG